MKKNFIIFLTIGFFLSVLIFMFVWFTNIHPLIVFDADDWTYIGSTRSAVPLWETWNPARILPEVLMPLCGSIAGFVVYPITGDYIFSVTITAAIVVSCFILVYLIAFYILLKKNEMKQITAFCVSLFFLIFHFLVFRGNAENNIYMFYAMDLTCYFYYLIPALLNSTVVCCLEADKRINLSILIPVVYFAIFSNMTASIILASYVWGRMVYDFAFVNKKGISIFIKSHVREIVILCLWFISLLFELSGGRANADMGSDTDFLTAVLNSIKGILEIVYYTNRKFDLFAILGILIALIMLIRLRKKNKKTRIDRGIFIFSLSAIISLVYTILLCAKVNYGYSTRSEYLFAFVFYGIMIIIFSISYILKRYGKLTCLLPISVIILICDVNTSGRTFRESNVVNISKEEVISISNNLLEQVITADEQQTDQLTLKVPKYESEDNWPQAIYMGERITNTLYEHGIIDSKMKITIFPVEEKSE